MATGDRSRFRRGRVTTWPSDPSANQRTTEYEYGSAITMTARRITPRTAHRAALWDTTMAVQTCGSTWLGSALGHRARCLRAACGYLGAIVSGTRHAGRACAARWPATSFRHGGRARTGQARPTRRLAPAVRPLARPARAAARGHVGLDLSCARRCDHLQVDRVDLVVAAHVRPEGVPHQMSRAKARLKRSSSEASMAAPRPPTGTNG